MSRQRCLRVAAALLFSAPAFAMAEDPVIPADEFVYCTVCHGVDLMGNPIIEAPRLSGMDAWYVERQLKAFKSGWRGGHEGDPVGMEMQPMAAALTDEQISAVARYVSETRSAVPARSLDGDATRGRGHYATCGACHGVQAEGNQALGGPALTGLDDWYLVTQLKNFRDGARGNQPGDLYGAQMRAAMQILADDEAIADVVAYIASLNEESE